MLVESVLRSSMLNMRLVALLQRLPGWLFLEEDLGRVAKNNCQSCK